MSESRNVLHREPNRHAIHLPGWLLLGTFRIEDALAIFAIGVALGAVFKFNGSLWSAVIAHSSNNLFLAIFFT